MGRKYQIAPKHCGQPMLMTCMLDGGYIMFQCLKCGYIDNVNITQITRWTE